LLAQPRFASTTPSHHTIQRLRTGKPPMMRGIRPGIRKRTPLRWTKPQAACAPPLLEGLFNQTAREKRPPKSDQLQRNYGHPSSRAELPIRTGRETKHPAVRCLAEGARRTPAEGGRGKVPPAGPRNASDLGPPIQPIYGPGDCNELHTNAKERLARRQANSTTQTET
ncbi:hypothetical protein BV898_20332, partial [Hypsibius exemplaris]